MKQITVLTRQDPDEITRVASILGDAGINIEDIDADRIEETGTIVLMVDQLDAALRALSDANLRAVTQDALVIRLEDKPGALATIAKRLRDAGIDVRSMHILRRDGSQSLVSLVVSDQTAAKGVLEDVMMKS
ncbi:ACT domain-containing protein [Brevifollis gellanilyticus]|uniref:Acetolactate synthase n=1 Tax=Brevifollis gellanilyticus TaxID=748831 RepID=A0A512MGE7_9BACT|nr:ACT domain-containing protein [Brevifollis gellanilyticus]GEP45421.1 acetolactate synthase [Brevifollis gellanilyticus]